MTRAVRNAVLAACGIIVVVVVLVCSGRQEYSFNAASDNGWPCLTGWDVTFFNNPELSCSTEGGVVGGGDPAVA